MITQKRVKNICPEYKTVYVTSDGKEFDRRQDAIQHEGTILEPRRIKSNYEHLETLDAGVYCYYITSKEDFDYLRIKEWQDNAYGTKYDKPDWYMAIRHSGGDFADDYEIIKANDYKLLLEKDLDTIKDLTSD